MGYWLLIIGSSHQPIVYVVKNNCISKDCISKETQCRVRASPPGGQRLRQAVIKTTSSPRVLASDQSSVRFGEPSDLPQGPTTHPATYNRPRRQALKARSERLAGEFASMTAVPTISGCCGGRHHLPQDLRGEARDPGTRRRPATRRRFRGRFRCPRRVFFADEKTLPSRGLFGRTVAYGHADVRAAL